MVNEFNPDYCVSPGDILKEELDAKDMSIDEFSDKTGISTEKIMGILSGTDNLTYEHAFMFAKFLGTSKEIWMNLEHTYREFLNKRIRF